MTRRIILIIVGLVLVCGYVVATIDPGDVIADAEHALAERDLATRAVR